MPYFGIKKSKIIWYQKCIISQYFGIRQIQGFLYVKINNKSNSFLVNYCTVKWPNRH